MNITKRESAYRIRVFSGKDEKGNSKFLYQTVRFDDPRFEGMTEKKRDKAIKAIAFDFEKQVGSLNVLPNVTFKCFAEKWFSDYAEIQQSTTTLERCVKSIYLSSLSFFSSKTKATKLSLLDGSLALSISTTSCVICATFQPCSNSLFI